MIIEEEKKEEQVQGLEHSAPQNSTESQTEFVKNVVTITWQKVAQDPEPPNNSSRVKDQRLLDDASEQAAPRVQTSIKVKTRVVQRQATGSEFFSYQYVDQNGQEITKEIISLVYERQKIGQNSRIGPYYGDNLYANRVPQFDFKSNNQVLGQVPAVKCRKFE